MDVIRDRPKTNQGPADWFTGTVYMDDVATGPAPSRFRAAAVHFTPGARTAWHTHPRGQVLYVLEGVGRAQARGGPVEEIRPCDRVVIAPGEPHWHGASPEHFMTHLAMHEADEAGSTADWAEHVSDEDYLAR